MSPTLEQIAELAGVSRSTVSRVVNDHPSVDPGTRARVQRVIHEQNYHPNAAARALASRRSQLIGLVVPQSMSAVFADPYFPMLIQGVSAACEERGYFMLLSFPVMTVSETLTRIVRGGHLDGLVVAASLTDNKYVAQLTQDGMPFVLVGRSDYPRCGDQRRRGQRARRRGGRTAPAAPWLHRRRHHHRTAGHDRCASIAAMAIWPPCRAAHIEPPDSYVQEGDWSEWSGSRAMDALLRLAATGPRLCLPRATTWRSARLKAIRAAGLRVPDDIALVGFDDIPLASALETPLTTVRQPIYRLGSHRRQRIDRRLAARTRRRAAAGPGAAHRCWARNWSSASRAVRPTVRTLHSMT